MKYDDKLTEEDGVYIQAAILFTSCSGQRRLRVVNLALNTGSSMAEMYRNCKYYFERTTIHFPYLKYLIATRISFIQN